MAAIDSTVGSVLVASLLLPGLTMVSGALRAESAPEQGLIALKVAHYSDGQPGWERVTVRSPQLYALVPLAGDWSLEGAWVGDSVSGATPRMHTFESGATPSMEDYRKVADVKVTRYFSRAAISAGLTYSTEHDYTSRALGLEARLSSDDNNTTWSLGYGTARDLIDNTFSGGGVADQTKRTDEWMLGLTQVVTPNDIVQINLTRSLGRGYFNDPYKDFENRPDFRNTSIALFRWNHHLESLDTSVRSSYRAYADSFGVRSHTLGLELVKSFDRWTFTPGLRAYTQSAADFYFDPVVDASGAPSPVLTRRFANRLTDKHSADQRLAAFGAVTAGIKVAYAIDPQTQVDFKVENYRQRASLTWGSGGSPYLEPFSAISMQFGVARKF